MKFITLIICLLMAGCGSTYDIEPVEDDVRVPTPDVQDSSFCDADADVDYRPCEVSCTLKVATPPLQDQALVSGSVFSACRRLSQEECIDPGTVWSGYIATVFKISRTECGGAPYCISTELNILTITVTEASWFYDAMREALRR